MKRTEEFYNDWVKRFGEKDIDVKMLTKLNSLKTDIVRLVKNIDAFPEKHDEVFNNITLNAREFNGIFRAYNDYCENKVTKKGLQDTLRKLVLPISTKVENTLIEFMKQYE